MNRRRFIGKGTVLGSSLMLSTGHLFNIHIKEPSSTDHFWYKALNKGPYIDTQRDHKSFGFSERSIFLSTDNGRSWRYELDFWDASNITFSHIFENGNILFATQNRLYLSEDNLRTLREIVVKNRDGSDYVPHVPKSPDFPGWYYMSLNSVNSWAIDGKEMLVWGNYANVKGGGVPVNIYYSTDYGRTIKVAYTLDKILISRTMDLRAANPEIYWEIRRARCIAATSTAWFIIRRKMHFMLVPGTGIERG